MFHFRLCFTHQIFIKIGKTVLYVIPSILEFLIPSTQPLSTIPCVIDHEFAFPSSLAADEDLLKDFPMPSPARPSAVKKKLEENERRKSEEIEDGEIGGGGRKRTKAAKKAKKQQGRKTMMRFDKYF
jgi:hypothetical protein